MILLLDSVAIEVWCYVYTLQCCIIVGVAEAIWNSLSCRSNGG
jgi:hypothetical protein